MRSLVHEFAPALVVLAVLICAMMVLGARRHALTNAIGAYLLLGIAIAAMQYWSGGRCVAWRQDSAFWQPILDWPGNVYANVWERDMPLRSYLMPQACDDSRMSPANVDALKDFGKHD